MNDLSPPDTPPEAPAAAATRSPRARRPAGWAFAVVLGLGASAAFCAESDAAPTGASPAAVPAAAEQPAAPTGPAGAETPPAPAATPAPGSPAVAAEMPKRGRDSLDPDLIYAVLVAETAVRRGDLAMAFSHYLHAAQLARDPGMAELAVRTAAGGGDDAGALRASDLWLELAPDSLGANQIAALLHLKAGVRKGVLDRLQRVVALSPDSETGYLQAAGVLGRALEPAERVALMQALAERNADSPEAWQALAALAGAVEAFDTAVAAAEKAQALRPDWDKPRVFLVKLKLAQGQRESARELLRQSLAERPEDQSLAMLYAQFLVDEKDYPGARDAFEKLLKARPADPDALFAAGVLSLDLGDYPAARGYLTRLYQVGDKRDEAAFFLGQAAERAGDAASAIEWYGKSQGVHVLDARVRTAVLRAKAGELERAREVLQQLRDLMPDEAQQLYLAEAEILDEAGRQEAAMQVYTTALTARPDDPDLLYGRAMYAVKLERLADAERDLRQIIAGDPNHADALNALGYTLADRTDRLAEAQGYVERAYRLKPNEPAIIDSMGWVNHLLGDNAKALEYLSQANDAMKDGEIAAHLGAVLWALGREDEARAVWTNALRDHPGHAYLLAVIARHPGAGIDPAAVPAAPAGGTPENPPGAEPPGASSAAPQIPAEAIPAEAIPAEAIPAEAIPADAALPEAPATANPAAAPAPAHATAAPESPTPHPTPAAAGSETTP